MYDDDDSGFELAYANEVTVDGKRSPRGRELAYELKQGGSALTGLGWVMLTWADAYGLAMGMAGPSWSSVGLRWA